MKVSLDVIHEYIEKRHIKEYRLLMGPHVFSNEKFFIRIPNSKSRVYSDNAGKQYIEFQVKKHNISLDLIDNLISSQFHLILCFLSSFQYILITCTFFGLRDIHDSCYIEFEILDIYEKNYSNLFK